MDKRTIIGIFLIVLVTFLMPYYLKWIAGDQVIETPPRSSDSAQVAIAHPDSAVEVPTIRESITPLPDKPVDVAADRAKAKMDVQLYADGSPAVKQATINAGRVVAKITSANGVNLTNWQLNRYKSHLEGPVDLMTSGSATAATDGGLAIELADLDGKELSVDNYNFYASFPADTTIELSEQNPSTELSFYLPVSGGKVHKKYIFYYNRYSVDVIISFEQPERFVGNKWYSLSWKHGLPATEEDRHEDYSYARSYAYKDGEFLTFDINEEGKVAPEQKDWPVEWAAIRTKYFLFSLIPQSPADVRGVTLSGYGRKEQEELIKQYNVAIDVGLSSGAATVSDSFTVYLGPLDLNELKPYKVGLENLVMNKDWYEGLFRYINIYIILPAFKLLHNFIPNYGWVIIVFSILIKLILHPLTKKSYQSMSEMQYIQPLMTEVREKYKSDPQRMNKEMMRLYKEHGINPLGGCLPTLLQMPLLFALFIVFRSTIQLRGEPFILWITDLSRPDALSLGFALPLIGSSIHILPFLMGLTMIWQSKMTVTDPKQKFMTYLMPVFITFIFYSLPSGLNLYYAVFNLLSMFQTRAIKKKMHPRNGVSVKAEPAPVTGQKKGKAQRQRKRRGRQS